jgi:DNA polymerase III gamma/tau subunit
MDNTWHTKYRPQKLDDLIGHTQAVTRLRGMLATNKIPGAFLFLGPSSVGKTTLARALATEINGKPAGQQQDYKEMNAGDSRTIEDMRELIRLSKFKAMNKKRIIVLDEAQQIVSNASAAAVLLKPLEDSGKTDTIWVLCSMDPSKFTTGNGKAIANRCTQFVLAPHTNKDLFAQGRLISKSEKMTYLGEAELKTIVKASSFEMRTLANLLQSVANYYEGLPKKPKTLDENSISEILQTAVSSDDALVVQVIVNTLLGKYALVQRALLDVKEPFQFINKLMYSASFLLSNNVLGGARHPKVWSNPTNRDILKALQNSKITLGQYAALNEAMVNIKAQSASFTVGEIDLLSARLYRLILEMFKRG